MYLQPATDISVAEKEPGDYPDVIFSIAAHFLARYTAFPAVPRFNDR